MKTEFLCGAVLASAAMIAQANPGAYHGGGGGFRGSYARRSGCSRSGACRRLFIDALHADAQLRRQDDLSGPPLFVIWNAFVPADWVSPAFDFSKSGNVYPLGSIHCGNDQTT